MLTQWQEWQKRYDDIGQELMSPVIEHQKRQELQKEHSYLGNLLSKHKDIEALTHELEEIQKQQQQTQDAELIELFRDEVVHIEKNITTLNRELEQLLYPADDRDDRSVFLEIRAGTGGQEAALFAADLLKMYTNYALNKQWHASLVDSSSTDLGGIREAILHIEGKNVYAHLKHESGVHRVQRVPKTEGSGRIHTSTATVAVLPEVEEVECAINQSDLRIDTYRAGGAGGQHVNRTDSAVRITHIPSGIVVACQDERSQHKNRAKAMKVLQSRIMAAQQEKHDAEESQKRKEMVGSGMRSEKVRTYNFPQNRVTDHQVEVTLKKLDMVMEGDLDEIIQALMAKEREDRKKNPVLKK
jgi:peptide chain release factor 1